MSAIPENPESIEILIVEDSPTQARHLAQILGRNGYRIRAASNGRVACELIRAGKPGLIISDVIMPEMDGYELCRRVKTDAKLSDIPIILVTTLSDPQDVIRGLECHADNFILKPYDEGYLLNRVRFILANREVRQAEHVGMGVEIYFNGRRHFITADRLQILNLLLSTYEAAIQRNRELSVAERNLRILNSRLEEANRELESFSYSVSHDLQAPIRAISAFSRMLLESNSSLSDRDRHYLDNICKGARHAAELIEALLNLSRLGRQPLSKRKIEMMELVRQVLAESSEERKSRDVDVRLDPLPDCTADPVLMKVVMVNLLSNAFKYTSRKEKAVVEIGCEQAGGEDVYFVRDNGAGFDMKYAGKLFGVFQRFHRSDEFEGTGVGLSTVHRIIQRHGGRIWAEAEVGRGATFRVVIPAESAADSIS